MTSKSDKLVNEVVNEVVEEVVNECCQQDKSFIKKQIVIIVHLIILFIGFMKCCNKSNVSNHESVINNDGL